MTAQRPGSPPPRLVPSDAAAAIVVVEDGRYLLQLRDSKPDIWFPDHWGLFGGAIDPGESAESALIRELREEIGLEVETLRYFTALRYDMSFANAGEITRVYYEVETTIAETDAFELREGRQMGLFSASQIANELRLTPYDAFCLWLHGFRGRIGIKGAG